MINKQVNHVDLTFLCEFSVLKTHCFSIIVFYSALHSHYSVFIYSIKLSFISHRLAVHLYLQMMMMLSSEAYFTNLKLCVSTSELKFVFYVTSFLPVEIRYISITYFSHCRMEIEDGVQLLSKISGLAGDKMTAARDIVTLLNGIPLALKCAGHYMQSKAAKSPDYSSTDFLNDVKLELQNFTKANGETSLGPTHAVVAMETKNLVQENFHLLHTFDFLGTCTSDWPIPITLIALHLRSPDFSLPPVVGSGPALPSQKPAEVKKEDSAGEEVEEMFLSIKKLAKNLESFMTAVKDNVDAIKAMLNPELPDMPQMVDGVVEMLKACPLVSVVRMEPMGKNNLALSTTLVFWSIIYLVW